MATGQFKIVYVASIYGSNFISVGQYWARLRSCFSFHCSLISLLGKRRIYLICLRKGSDYPGSVFTFLHSLRASLSTRSMPYHLLFYRGLRRLLLGGEYYSCIYNKISNSISSGGDVLASPMGIVLSYFLQIIFYQ